MALDFHTMLRPSSVVTQKSCNVACQKKSHILRFRGGEDMRWFCISKKWSEIKTLARREKEVCDV